MKRIISHFSLILVIIFGLNISLSAAHETPGVIYKDEILKGKMIDTGFLYGDSNYHAIIQASDGNVYYVICSHNKKAGARMFLYNPKSGDVRMIADLTEVVGEDRTKVINQGKVHSDFYELNGKLYFATHAGAWDETYPGGHFMCYDIKKQKFEDFGIGVQADGIVAMTMDVKRRRMYGITWPGYLFTYYDVNTDTKKTWGKAYATTQQGPRSIGIDPRTGNAYWHNIDDTIECYNYKTEVVKTLDKPRFNGGMFRIPIDESSYKVQNVWRSIRWSDAMQRFYGIMYNTDWLFSFEPETAEIEIIDRLTSAPNRKSGKLIYSSLAFELSQDGETVYYISLTEVDQPDTTKKVNELHLVTYDIPLRRYIDHGVIELEDGRRPRYCQGLEVGTDGNLYIVGWTIITDKSSEKWKKKYEIDTAGKPAMELERGVELQEINLVVLKNPLR